jgi:hypothetical protein
MQDRNDRSSCQYRSAHDFVCADHDTDFAAHDFYDLCPYDYSSPDPHHRSLYHACNDCPSADPRATILLPQWPLF